MFNSFYHAIVIGFIMLVAWLPWLDGILFKESYLRLVNAVNKDVRIKIDVLDYHEGWLKSSAKVRITIINNGLSAPYLLQPHVINLQKPFSFDLDQDISHGPLTYNPISKKLALGFASINSVIHLPNKLSSGLLGNLHSEGILEMSTLAKFNKNWVGQLRIPKLVIDIPTISHMVWDGVGGDYTLEVKHKLLNHVLINLNIGTMVLQVNKANDFIKQIQFRPATYSNDTVHDATGLWSGSGSLSIPGLQIVTSDNKVLAIGQFMMNNIYGLSSTTFYNTQLILNLADIKLPYPPINTISNMSFKFSANDFNAQGVNDYIRFVRTATPTAIKNMNMGTLANLLIHTIKPTSILFIETQAVTPLGKISCSSRTNWQENVAAPQTMLDIINNTNTLARVDSAAALAKFILTAFQQHVAAIKAHAETNQVEASTPTPAVEVTQQTMDILAKIGYIHKSDIGYSTIFTIQDGIMKINGRAINSK